MPEPPARPGPDPFTARLRDLLATLESAALLGASAARVRGLGEHLRFACLAVPCDEALVALEMETLGRLVIPVVADEHGARPQSLELLPVGTPFAYLLGGGSGFAAQIAPGDAMVASLLPALARPPVSGIFVPLRLGDAVVGGAALFTHEFTHERARPHDASPARALGARELVMAERLAEVLALTVESFRTERVIFELFARAMPDLLGERAETSLPEALAEHLRAMRLPPGYRRRLALATAVGRVVDHGEAEADLAEALLTSIDAYARGLTGPARGVRDA
jgi:hypothetical protein